MAVVSNLAFWMVSYGMFYWGITCYRAIFSLGPWRYLKKRTGRFLRFIKRRTLMSPHVFNETDWERRSTKIIGKAIIGICHTDHYLLSLVLGIGALVIYSLFCFSYCRNIGGRQQI